MKLTELNDYLVEKQLTSISLRLETHITNIENAVKKVNTNTLEATINAVKRTGTLIDQIKSIIKSEKNILNFDAKTNKKIIILELIKQKFESIKPVFKDTTFKKEIIQEINSIIQDNIEKIKKIIQDHKKAAKTITDEITKSSVPQGYAIDLKTKKGYVHKKDKKYK